MTGAGPIQVAEPTSKLDVASHQRGGSDKEAMMHHLGAFEGLWTLQAFFGYVFALRLWSQQIRLCLTV